MFSHLKSITAILVVGFMVYSLPVQAAQTPTEAQKIQTSTLQKLVTTKTVLLSVPGMTCPVCPITVKKALTNIKGVTRVSVNYKNKTATVSFDPKRVNISMLTEATKHVGYPSSVKTGSK